MIIDTTVVNRHHGVPFDVYVGRPSIFGNPFHTGTRDDNISQYRMYFFERCERDAVFRNEVLKLRGKRLACSCAPKLCHACVIVEWLEAHPDLRPTV